MANFRITDLNEETTLTSSHYIEVDDGTGNTEKFSIPNLITYILNQFQYYTSIVDATKNDQITHSLGSTMVKAYLFDENGDEVQGWQYSIDDSNNITPNIGISLSGRGTWKITIVKLRSS